MRMLVLVGVLLQAATLLRPALSWGQVATAITSSGLGTAVVPPPPGGTVYNITGGTPRGSNLFHSFGAFSVGADHSANFNNTNGLTIENILSRVTGGNPSNIFGTIDSSSYGGANFWLINPAGVIFGATASLNVSGSFHVSTADYVRFPDAVLPDGTKVEVKFLATDSPLPSNGPITNSLTANPIAFGFMGPTAARISIEGSFLRVPEGQTLSVVGGDAPFAGETETGLKMTGATLVAPGGRIQIASVASAGEVTIRGLDVAPGTALGKVHISGNALIGASGIDEGIGTGGGTVLIRGGRLIVEGSRIVADTGGDVEGPRLIDIQVGGDIVLTGGASISTLTITADRGGDVRIEAGSSLQMQDSSFIQTATFGDNSAGDISANVGSLILNVGASIFNFDSSLAAHPAANLRVTASDSGSVTISGGGSGIFSNAVGIGDGSRVGISASSLTLDDGGTITSGTFSEGRGGDIVVEVGRLNLTNGGTIRSSTASTGAAGKVTVTATESATISGSRQTTSGLVRSGISSGSISDGPPGDISLNLSTLTLTDGGVIQSGSEVEPQGGDVVITARDAIDISNGGGISSRAHLQDVGQVTISAPTASLTIDNGFISASTQEPGRAGNISVDVRTLTLARGGQIASSSELSATGAGGNVTITANSVSISGSSPSGVPSSPFSADPRSGIFSSASGTGPAGSISVVTDLLRLENATITTQTERSAGGDIKITSTGSLLHLTNSQITTSVRGGEGGGGDITIGSGLHPLDFVVLNNSGIHANAFGGPGGNIDIFANVFVSSLPISTAVTASSALSTPGTIDIQAPITDVSGSLARLPAAVLEAAALLRASCAARLAGGKTSTLVVAGREGLPLEPGGLLPSPLLAEELGSVGPSRSEEHPWETLPRFSLSALAPACSR